MEYQDICVAVGVITCYSPADNGNIFKFHVCITIWIYTSCEIGVCNWDEVCTKKTRIIISIRFISCIIIGSGFRYCCSPPYPLFWEHILNLTIVITTLQGCLLVTSTHYRSTSSNITDLSSVVIVVLLFLELTDLVDWSILRWRWRWWDHMSTHMRGHRVDHTSSIRDGLSLRYLSLVTTKLITTSIITSIVARVAIVIICTLTFVRLILSSHLSQSVAYILGYIELLVLFKTIRWMNFNNISIDACNFPFIITTIIRIPRSPSSSSLSTASTTYFPATSFPSTTS